jgi:Tat protein translocase TatB subunit
MDILGIGFWELLFIFIIALMVFGPRRLPEIAGKAGRIVRDLRNMSQGFLAEWQREITVATRLEELEQVRQELEETRQSLRQTQTELASGAAQIGQSLNTAFAPLKQTSQTTSPNPSVEKSAETSAATESNTQSDATPPVVSSTEEGETVPEPAEGEKNGNTVSLTIPQPAPTTVTPPGVVE